MYMISACQQSLGWQPGKAKEASNSMDLVEAQTWNPGS